MPRQNNIQIRRGTAAEWSSSNPVLDDGEIGYDKTNNNIKIGDGTKTWSSLSYTTGETGPASEALKLNSLTFNGSTTTFALASGATTVYPASAAALIISLNGVVQEPDVDYSVSGSNITFAQAPTSGTDFFGISLNGIAAPITAASITSGTLDIARIPTGTSSSTVCIGNDARLSDTRTPTDGTVTTAKIVDSNVTYAKIQNVSATDKLLGRSTAGAGVIEEVTCTSFARTILDDADAATARATLGVTIGTNVQAYDAELAALAGLTSVADALPYFTGSGTATTTTLSSFGRSLIDDADAATARATLGVTIGTHVQAYDAELAALASVTSAANALPYFTGSGTATTTTLSSFGRSLIDDADAATARTTLSVQPTASPAFTGAATFDNAGNVVPLTITNTGTANSFVVNDASGDATPFTIDASGNVGIKATSLASSLNVNGNSAFYQDANGTPSLGSKSFYAATFENLSSGYGLAIGGVSGATGSCMLQVQSFVSSVAYDMLLQPLGGNVGIGTSSPGLGLTVEKNNGNGWSAWFGSSSISDRVGLGVRSSRASIQGFTSAGSPADIVVQPDSGNVGIGTSSPGAKLDCRGVIQALGTDATTELLVAHGNGTFTNEAAIALRRGGVNMGKIGANYFTGMKLYVTDGAGGAATERIGISTGGVVNIVGGGSESAPILTSTVGTSDTGVWFPAADQIAFAAAGVTRLVCGPFNRTLVNGNSESYGFGVRWSVNDGLVYFGPTAAGQTPDAGIFNAGGGRIATFKNDGEVLVGSIDNGAYNLQCNGTGVWGAGAYVNGSDERIKDDITPLGEATSVISAMQPVTFRYKDSWSKDQSVQPGFVAQQLQQSLAGTPYIDGVVQQGSEYLSVAYQTIIPLLVKALQESNARIAALEERLSNS